MCDISIKTNLKSKTIYKVAFKDDNEYFAIFSLLNLKIGKVSVPSSIKESYENCGNYNPLMVDKTSGFSSLRAAKRLLNYKLSPSYYHHKIVILKMKIRGNIFKGTSDKIALYFPNDFITYAGEEIISMEEVYCSK